MRYPWTLRSNSDISYLGIRTHMRKSQTIRLTVVAAMAMAARAQQSPVAPSTPLAPRTCEERRNLALTAGTPFNESCVGSGAHTAVHGGFGATGKDHSGGG